MKPEKIKATILGSIDQEVIAQAGLIPETIFNHTLLVEVRNQNLLIKALWQLEALNPTGKHDALPLKAKDNNGASPIHYAFMTHPHQEERQALRDLAAILKDAKRSNKPALEEVTGFLSSICEKKSCAPIVDLIKEILPVCSLPAITAPKLA